MKKAKPHKNAVAKAPEKPVTVKPKPEAKAPEPPISPKAEKKPDIPPAVQIGVARFSKDQLAMVAHVLTPLLRGNTLPVLNHVLITSANGRMSITGTDLTTYATFALPAPEAKSPLALKVLEARFLRENGAFLVPMAELRRIAKAADKSEAILLTGHGCKGAVKHGELTPHKVVASYMIGGSIVTEEIGSMPISEMPAIPVRPYTDELAVDEDMLRGIINAMAVASDDSTRYVINSVCFDGSEKGHHTIVGTDGRRMFAQNSQSFPFTKSRLLPATPLTRPLCSPLLQTGWTIDFSDEAKNQPGAYARIRTPRWEIQTRQIEGNYPNWRQVLPDESGCKYRVTLSPEARAFIVANLAKLPNPNDSEYFILEIDKGVTLSRANSRLPVPGATATGKDLKIGFSSKFFAEAVKQGFSEILLTDAMSPATFREGSMRHVLMPARLAD